MSTPADWYPDPEDASRLRYWDETAWTDNLAPIPPRTTAEARALLKAEAQRKKSEVQREKADEKQRQAYLQTPVGQAEAAHQRGDHFFQVEIPHEEFVMPFMHNALDLDSQRVKRSAGAPDLLGRIEQLGWHLEHAQWLFVQSGAVSREYGGFVNREHEVTTVTGRVTGIYLFRRSDHANE